MAKLPATLGVSLGNTTGLLTHAIERVREAKAKAEVEATALKAEIERRLVESGGTPEELVEFDRLSAVAATYDARKEAADAASKATVELLASFTRIEAERTALVGTHRAEIAAVFARVQERFGNRIRISVVNEGICNALDKWIRELRQQGITRWWNDRCERPGTTPPPLSSLISALDADRLHELGMSPQVAGTFRETVTSELRLSLRALRNPDKYSLELLVGDGAYREMDKLSGGQQVSLLLSLLLETEDNRPLLIDQPEDELDNAFLFGTILPILRRLKGHRQIVFATHNANIVVNGDADQVIYLTADHEHGTVAAQGAIETPAVKQAIIDTVDGGGEAFKLRQAKYGY